MGTLSLNYLQVLRSVTESEKASQRKGLHSTLSVRRAVRVA